MATRRALSEFSSLDRALYRAVARTSTPELDVGLSRLSNTANHSVLWFGLAAGLAVFGGRRSRRAAVVGAVAIGVTSAVVNLVVKPTVLRQRPEREVRVGMPHVRMPGSTSFPSGHSASAFAFASAVGGEVPLLAAPLRALATGVAYSRVHTGVHYPSDVVVGSLIGATVGAAVSRVLRRSH